MVRRYGSIHDSDDETSDHEREIARCDHYTDNLDDEGLTPLTGKKGRLGKRSRFNNSTSSSRSGRSGGSGTRRGGGGGGGSPSCGGGCWRWYKNLSTLIFLPLLFLTLSTLYYSYNLQIRLSTLSDELSTVSSATSSLSSNLTVQSTKLSDLDAIVSAHSKVLQRFNNSISNSDVLNRLHELEKEWKEGEERVEKEMDDTKVEIRGVLESTKKSIDETVS